MCPAAVHTGTGHILSLTTTSGDEAQVHSLQPRPPSTLPCRLKPGMNPTYHPGPPHRKRGFILGEANVPIPASVPHAYLHLGSSAPSLLSWAKPTPGTGLGPTGVPLSQEGLALTLAAGILRSPQPHWIPPLGGPPHPWLASADSAPDQCQEGASHLRADLPKPSSDSAAAAVSLLH